MHEGEEKEGKRFKERRRCGSCQDRERERQAMKKQRRECGGKDSKIGALAGVNKQ